MEKIVEVPVEKIVEVPVESENTKEIIKEVEVPVEVIKEVQVEVEVIKEVEKECPSITAVPKEDDDETQIKAEKQVRASKDEKETKEESKEESKDEKKASVSSMHDPEIKFATLPDFLISESKQLNDLLLTGYVFFLFMFFSWLIRCTFGRGKRWFRRKAELAPVARD